MGLLRFFLVVFFLMAGFFSSCSRPSEGSYLSQGCLLQEQLVSELQEVHTLQELFDRQEALTSLFDEIARLAVEARSFQIRHSTSWDVPSECTTMSERLSVELVRVLQIPGARPFIEKCQSRGLHRLDEFERKEARRASDGAFRDQSKLYTQTR